MTILKEPRRCKLAIYSKSVEQTMSFEYLVRLISQEDRYLKEEVLTQTMAIASASDTRCNMEEYIYEYGKQDANLQDMCTTYVTETLAKIAATNQLLRTTEIKTLT